MTQDIAKFIECGEWVLPKELIYVGCPYTSKDKRVMEDRVQLVSEFTGLMMSRGHLVLSPVSATDTVLKAVLARLGIQEFQPKEGWYRFCLALLCHCDRMWVLQLPGWQESEGLRLEIAFALGKGMPVDYIDPDRHFNWDSAKEDIPF